MDWVDPAVVVVGGGGDMQVPVVFFQWLWLKNFDQQAVTGMMSFVIWRINLNLSHWV